MRKDKLKFEVGARSKIKFELIYQCFPEFADLALLFIKN
jgi:hypothetical protein